MTDGHLESTYALEAERPPNPGYYLDDEPVNVCADCPVSLICAFAFTNRDAPSVCMEQVDTQEYYADQADRRAVLNGTALY